MTTNFTFDLIKCLDEVRSHLPNQGPIKNFVAQLKIPQFLHLGFDEALERGEQLYHAVSYMPLSFYRQKYSEGRIKDRVLDDVLSLYAPLDLSLNEKDLLRKALFELNELSDFPEQNLLDPQINLKTSSTISLRDVLNDRLPQKMDHEINPVLFRLVSSYLDQGVSWWTYFDSREGFFYAVKNLLQESLCPVAPFVANKSLLNTMNDQDVDAVILQALHAIVQDPALFHRYVFESLLSHPGWSGMVSIIERDPSMLQKPCAISLKEFLAVKLLLEQHFIAKHLGPNYSLSLDKEPPSEKTTTATRSIAAFLERAHVPLNNNSAVIPMLTPRSIKRLWHEAFERTYYQEASAILVAKPQEVLSEDTLVQAIFCMDDRECSTRRWLEKFSPHTETFSMPGFFNVDTLIYEEHSGMMEKVCPLPVKPQHILVRKHNPHEDREYVSLLTYAVRYGANNILLDFLASHTMGHLSAFNMLLALFFPGSKLFKNKGVTKESATNFEYLFDEKDPTFRNYQKGYTDEEMKVRLKRALVSIGLTKDFAPVIFFISHGSKSANNPHFAAYDCGACSGRPGRANAMVFALMANRKEVRDLLKDDGIVIPDTTRFVGAFHNTCTDEFECFDEDLLPVTHQRMVAEFKADFHNVSIYNAKERSEKFALVKKDLPLESYLLEVNKRAHALFETRPELGHARNALGIVGRRMRTLLKNFDRRAFLQSYDPTTDGDGVVLADILTAFLPVAAGISLEYFFSRMDPSIYGSGTKIAHNVVSLLGVGNGLDDDLRFGLPVQMTELHEPIRLLLILEHEEAVIKEAVIKNPLFSPWIDNEWVRVAMLSPTQNMMHLYEPEKKLFRPFFGSHI